MSTSWTQTPQACVSTYFTIATNLPSLPAFTRYGSSLRDEASFYRLAERDPGNSFAQSLGRDVENSDWTKTCGFPP